VTRAQAAALAVVLAAATLLRVAGLDQGLRHPPHGDESAFVVNVHRMLDEGSLDHRYYEYPGLFFYLLMPVLGAVMGGDPPGPAAYLAARGVTAAFGVIAVGLQFAFARMLMPAGAALLSSALLAVSLVAVQTAHTVRPDVVLQAFFLAAFIAMLRLDGGGRRDAAAGLALGAAAAVKFSAVFLLPALAARRLLVPKRRLSGLAACALAAAIAFVALSPYSVLHLGEFVEGVETQVSYHYEEAEDPGLVKTFPQMVFLYLRVWAKTLGGPAAALSVIGLLAAWRDPRRWGPLLTVPLLAIVVFATSQVLRDRFLLPAMGVGFALAAAGWSEVWAVSRRLGILVAAVALALPLLASVRYLSDVARPATGDRAVDWAASLPAGARVATRLDLGLDTSRLEVLKVTRLGRRQALASDYVIATDRDEPATLAGLEPLAVFEPAGRYNGPPITVYAVPDALRAERTEVPLAGATLAASSGRDTLANLADGNRETWWHTEELQQAGDSVEVALPVAENVCAVEMLLGGEPKFAAREVRLELRRGGAWVRPPWVDGRPRVESQRPPASQLLLLARPGPADAIRLTLTKNSGRRWGMAELVVWRCAP
jgi:hypothetical protein